MSSFETLHFIINMSSSRNAIWLLKERDNDYRSLMLSAMKDYFVGVRREWAYRVGESIQLNNDLNAMGLRVPSRDSFGIYPIRDDSVIRVEFKRRVVNSVACIREENNRMLMRMSRRFMYELAQDFVRASGRELTEAQQRMLLRNPDYLSNGYMSDESL